MATGWANADSVVDAKTQDGSGAVSASWLGAERWADGGAVSGALVVRPQVTAGTRHFAQVGDGAQHAHLQGLPCNDTTGSIARERTSSSRNPMAHMMNRLWR